MNLLGDFGLSTIGGREVQYRALVPWGSVVLFTAVSKLRPVREFR